jgi:hypothetical protein
VAVVDELVYAMGGRDICCEQNTAERYDCKTNQWSLIAPMNTKRSHASATSLNGNMNPKNLGRILTKCVNERRMDKSCLSVSMSYLWHDGY